MKNEMIEVNMSELATIEGGEFWGSVACGFGIALAGVAVFGATAAGVATFGLSAPVSLYTAGAAVGTAAIACGRAAFT